MSFPFHLARRAVNEIMWDREAGSKKAEQRGIDFPSSVWELIDWLTQTLVTQRIKKLCFGTQVTQGSCYLMTLVTMSCLMHFPVH